MLPLHVSTPADLQTPHQTICDGFLAQAIQKTKRAQAYVQEAQKLDVALQQAVSVEDLINLPAIQTQLVAAAGISDKARKYFTADGLKAAVTEVLKTIYDSNPNGWRAEIVYRFLLTRGDTLGGSMRNYIGALGGVQLVGAVVSALASRNIAPTIVTAKTSAKIVSLEWTDQLLVFDKKPKFIDKNIDAILLDKGKMTPAGTVSLEQRGAYVACGELKGGIDPGGADEHWKTAGTAFTRIRTVFEPNPPHLFFVAAAIEAAMAAEIFQQLQDGRLEYAANLTKPQQVTALADWLVSL